MQTRSSSLDEDLLYWGECESLICGDAVSVWRGCRPGKHSGARGTPVIQGRKCGCTPVESRRIGVGWTVDKSHELLILRLYEAKRYGIPDHHAQRIEKPEHINKNDGCGRLRMSVSARLTRKYESYVWCGSLVVSRRRPP